MSDLVNAIVEADPTLKEELEEETQKINEVLIDESNSIENTTNEVKLFELNQQTSESIEEALKTSSKVKEALQEDVNKKLKMYGGIEAVLARLSNPDLSKTPRYLKKMMREHLGKVILYLREKNSDLANTFETLLEKIKEDLIKTKPKKIIGRLNDQMERINERIKNQYAKIKSEKWFGGSRGKRQRMNKTKKYIKGGDDGEGFLYLIAWISFLIACCCTGIGCFICGPLLVATICLGIGANVCGSLVLRTKNDNSENKKGGKRKNKRTKKTKRNYK